MKTSFQLYSFADKLFVFVEIFENSPKNAELKNDYGRESSIPIALWSLKSIGENVFIVDGRQNISKNKNTQMLAPRTACILI